MRRNEQTLRPSLLNGGCLLCGALVGVRPVEVCNLKTTAFTVLGQRFLA